VETSFWKREFGEGGGRIKVIAKGKWNEVRKIEN